MTSLHLTILLLLFNLSIYAQQLTDTHPIIIKTDRSSYISGDDLFFSVFLYNGIVTDNEPGPDVYIDITDVDNKWVEGLGTITMQINGTANGVINLPDTLLTGYYKIRAYTNYPNLINHFSSIEIFITNRFGKEPEAILRDMNSHRDTIKTSQIISIEKDKYRTRENITINLSCNDSIKALVKIVTKKQWEEQSMPVFGTHDSFVIDERYTPLTPYDGIIVAGTVTDSTNTPISDAIVLVSMQDSVVRIKYDITDSTGTFCVLLHNYYNEQQIFINAFNKHFQPYYNANIELRNQFDFGNNSSNNLIQVYTVTDSSELDKALIAKAFELQAFMPVGISDRPVVSNDHLIIGKPRHTAYTDNYIPLNNFREITRELTPFIRLRKNKSGEAELRILNEYNITMNNPLLLVDGVPLTQLDKLLDKGSDIIKKVETQNKSRHFGNINFDNGIISIWTHNYNFWEKCKVPGTFEFLVHSSQKPLTENKTTDTKDRLPNLKQTIYWNPNINTTEQKCISAQLSDECGEFVIEFFGIQRDGKIIKDFKLINVK